MKVSELRVLLDTLEDDAEVMIGVDLGTGEGPVHQTSVEYSLGDDTMMVLIGDLTLSHEDLIDANAPACGITSVTTGELKYHAKWTDVNLEDGRAITIWPDAVDVFDSPQDRSTNCYLMQGKHLGTVRS